MRSRWILILAAIVALLGDGRQATARELTASSAETGCSVEFNPSAGEYRIVSRHPAWTFGGKLGSPARAVKETRGRDRIGAYQEIRFAWHEGRIPLEGAIRLYQTLPIVLFSYTYLQPARAPSVAFPNFTQIPAHLYHFSYRNAPFAAPQFSLGQYSTPWLFFDGKANAMVISPASRFIIATMRGDGIHQIAGSLNSRLSSVPGGFTESALMAVAPGIRHTFGLWGHALTALAGKKRPSDEADVTLRDYGYWTDHGAYYYYKNFDPKLGYAGTLRAVIAQWRKEKIPVGYLQLDSWWYDKSFKGMSPDDRTGRWNAGGGIMRYRADASLFPHGLKAFEQSVGLPLVTHSRWISRRSPYRSTYQISGVAPIGMKWWNDITAYLASSGVVTYEQDWQSVIDQRSPAFKRTVRTGDAFYDHMAAACGRHGMTMQYCMALPCDFLEGSRYSNLTSIRVSDDRFSRPRWRHFLYTSELADAIGAWPWSDVFMSDETDNLLLSTLSAGPVGTGDALGSEDRQNILKAARADGVLVKPDEPILPLDRMYIADARHSNSPFIANTWSDDGPIRTAYVFAFSRSADAGETVRFTPAEVGTRAPACIYNFFTHQTRRVEPGGHFQAALGPDGASYYIVAPLGPSGLALFGDIGQFASMGKERIASLAPTPRSLSAEVLFASGENSVTLAGCARSKPAVSVRHGHASAVEFENRTGAFSVRVSPELARPAVKFRGSNVRRVTVTFTER